MTNVGSKNLTSKAAARILGVSEASIKRWADGGLLPAIKTAGGHRRFRPEDVVFFRNSNFRESIDKQTREPERRLSTGKRIDDSTLVNQMFELLLEGRSEEVLAFLTNLYLNGQSIAQIADSVLCPALRRIGDYWQRGDLSVVQEHVASRAGLEALRRLRPALGPIQTGRKLAICCAAEGDFHEFPFEIAALTLAAEGWEVINLGANTPFYALNEAVNKFKPRIACIASTILKDLDRTVREFKEFLKTARRTETAVVLGGAGFSGETQKRLEADLHAKDFRQLEEFAAALAN